MDTKRREENERRQPAIARYLWAALLVAWAGGVGVGYVVGYEAGYGASAGAGRAP